MKKNVMSFDEWRQKDNAGWYLSREKDEDVFERYLAYKHEQEQAQPSLKIEEEGEAYHLYIDDKLEKTFNNYVQDYLNIQELFEYVEKLGYDKNDVEFVDEIEADEIEL